MHWKIYDGLKLLQNMAFHYVFKVNHTDVMLHFRKHHLLLGGFKPHHEVPIHKAGLPIFDPGLVTCPLTNYTKLIDSNLDTICLKFLEIGS